MQQIDWLKVFCVRVCHDMLSPVGGLQIAVDLWKQSPDEETATAIESASADLVRALDLIRQAYGYSTNHFSWEKLYKLVTSSFGNRLEFKGKFEPTTEQCWILLRLCIWLRYKLLEESKVTVEIEEGKISVDASQVYLEEIELDYWNGKENKDINPYLIYLALFFKHMPKEASFSVNQVSESSFKFFVNV